MHFGLTQEQDMIVSTVRSFVEAEIYPHEDLVERTGEVPAEIAAAIVAVHGEINAASSEAESE